MSSTTTLVIMGMALTHFATSMVVPNRHDLILTGKRTNAFIEASAVDAFTPYGNKVPGPGPALLKYLTNTQAGLNQLSASIDEGNYVTAQNTYTTLSGYFDAILYYMDSENQGCANTGAGHQVNVAEAQALVAAIEGNINTLATVTGLGNADQVKHTCEARADFFNSGLREFIFHNPNSGTGN